MALVGPKLNEVRESLVTILLGDKANWSKGECELPIDFSDSLSTPPHITIGVIRLEEEWEFLQLKHEVSRLSDRQGQ